MEPEKPEKTAEEKEQTAIAIRSNLAMTPTGLVLTNLDEMYRFAQYVSQSPFAPKDMRDPVSIVVAIQYGAELGLSMMAALANIAVINGKPSVYGDVMLALVRASGKLQDFSEGLVVKVDGKLACSCAKWAREGECIHSRAAVIPFSREGEERVGVCLAHRKGSAEPGIRTFGVVDAKVGGLWRKAGPWTTSPDRMLMFRPRGFVLRDEFGDVLKGLVSREEAMDMEEVQPTTSHKLASTLKERLKAAPIVVETVNAEPDAIDAEEVQPEPKPPATAVRRRTATKPAPGRAMSAITDAQPAAAAPEAPKPAERPAESSERNVALKALHRRLVDHDVVIGDVMKRFGVETFRELTDEQIAGLNAECDAMSAPAPKEEELPPWEPSPRETLIADLRTQIQDAGQMEAVVVAAYDATKAKLEDLSDAELKAVASEVSEWET